MSKPKSPALVWILAAVSLALVLVGFGLPGGPIALLLRQPSRAELTALRAEGDAIVHALEAQRSIHDRYPTTLPASLDLSRGEKYGGWRYECVADCTTFELYVGNYGDYFFEIHWLPDKKTWNIDT